MPEEPHSDHPTDSQPATSKSLVVGMVIALTSLLTIAGYAIYTARPGDDVHAKQAPAANLPNPVAPADDEEATPTPEEQHRTEPSETQNPKTANSASASGPTPTRPAPLGNMRPEPTGPPLDLGAPDGAPPGPEMVLQRFVRRNGPANVVVIRTSHALHLRPGVLIKQLTNKLGGGRSYFATRPSENAIMAIRYEGDLQELAAHVDWGEVTSIDADRRLIFVDAK